MSKRYPEESRRMTVLYYAVIGATVVMFVWFLWSGYSAAP